MNDISHLVDSDAKKAVDGAEVLVRLLNSPLMYDAIKGQVTPDAFDLRCFSNGKNEEYLSLGRMSKFLLESDFKKYLRQGYNIFDKKKRGNFIGYGTFKYSEALRISNNSVEVNPLLNSPEYHVGMFYKNEQGGYYEGSLKKKNMEMVELLKDLADLLEKNITIL